MDSCHLFKYTNIFAYKKFNILAGYKVEFLKELISCSIFKKKIINLTIIQMLTELPLPEYYRLYYLNHESQNHLLKLF